MPHRIIQINEQIKKELKKILHQDFPNEIIEVNFVNTKKDLSCSDIYFTVLSNHKSIYDQILSSSGRYWKMLSKKIILRRLPKLNFIKDVMKDDIERIETIISEKL